MVEEGGCSWMHYSREFLDINAPLRRRDNLQVLGLGSVILGKNPVRTPAGEAEHTERDKTSMSTTISRTTKCRHNTTKRVRGLFSRRLCLFIGPPAVTAVDANFRNLNGGVRQLKNVLCVSHPRAMVTSSFTSRLARSQHVKITKHTHE